MEQVKHECGIAMLRLRRKPQFYEQKYEAPFYGTDLLFHLMEKQYNRGQEAAGIGCVCSDAPPDSQYMLFKKAQGIHAIGDIYSEIMAAIPESADARHSTLPFSADCLMGHLRYSTTGRTGIEHVHPFLHKGSDRATDLLLCGNFNFTNTSEILQSLRSDTPFTGQESDAAIILRQTGEALDRQLAEKGEISIAETLKEIAPSWDGGYVICGLHGNGYMWTLRDAHGIRPAFYFADDEIVAVASERAALQSVLRVEAEKIKELPRGAALLINPAGDFRIEQILALAKESQCSFERIYFSRGNDRDIYRERKMLGRLLAPAVRESVGADFENTVFTFIPNTAETAYYGLIEGLREQPGSVARLRAEKVMVKDIRLRTFMANSAIRPEMAAQAYDITYSSIVPGRDTLVVVDDSIVRGTTLRQSIISRLDSLRPKTIIFVSSSPQVRFPDYYGIDMPTLEEFVAFRAAISLLKESGRGDIISAVYEKCLRQRKASGRLQNHVKELYEPFTERQISARAASLLTPQEVRAEIKMIYQTVADTHKAIPHHTGDWYFTGDYPTPGGYRLLNETFIRYCEKEKLE